MPAQIAAAPTTGRTLRHVNKASTAALVTRLMDDVPDDAGGADLIPADKVQQAVGKVRTGASILAGGFNHSAEVKRMVPLVAALLNQHAGEFPKLNGRELCLTVSAANVAI